MQEVTIKYNSPHTLKLLKQLAKYLDFVVSKPSTQNIVGQQGVKSVITPGDETIDIAELTTLFTGANIDAKELRKLAWAHKK